MGSSVNPVSPPWALTRGGAAVSLPPNLAGPGGLPSAAIARSLEVMYPELFPIPDAHEFNPSGSIASAAVQNGIAITGATIDIPNGSIAVIRNVNIYITNMLTTTNVTYSVLVNNVAPQGYQGLSIFPRVSPFVGNSFDSLIRVNGAATIQVVFSNLDGGPYQIGASFSGWYWPLASDIRWKNSGV